MKIRVSRNASFRKPGRVVRIDKGKGAGYINGWTLYYAAGDLYHKGRDGRQNLSYTGLARPRIGFTRNANAVPFPKH
jgi:hypothetical protein